MRPIRPIFIFAQTPLDLAIRLKKKGVAEYLKSLKK